MPVRRGGGGGSGDIPLTAWEGIWISPTLWYPTAWGYPIITNPTGLAPLPCFRSGDVTDWVASNAVVFAPSIDNSAKCEGDYSMRLDATVGSIAETVTVDVSDIDYSDYDQFEMDIYANTTQADLLIIEIRNNGSWLELGRATASGVNTLTHLTFDLTGISHDDVEKFRITSYYNSAFIAYVDRFVFTSSKTSPWKAITWNATTPASTSVRVDILSYYTGATLVSNVTSGQDLGLTLPADTPIQLKVTLNSSVGGSTPEVTDITVNWIPDLWGDRRGEEATIYEYVYS